MTDMGPNCCDRMTETIAAAALGSRAAPQHDPGSKSPTDHAWRAGQDMELNLSFAQLGRLAAGAPAVTMLLIIALAILAEIVIIQARGDHYPWKGSLVSAAIAIGHTIVGPPVRRLSGRAAGHPHRLWPDPRALETGQPLRHRLRGVVDDGQGRAERPQLARNLRAHGGSAGLDAVTRPGAADP